MHPSAIRSTAAVLTLLFSAATSFVMGQSPPVAAKGSRTVEARVVRLAKIEIDAARSTEYLAALKEEIETSVRVEPGVLGLYAVADKEHPNQITLLEMYADAAAYRSHLETPHFKKYKDATQAMVRSLTLVETDPVMLCTKSE